MGALEAGVERPWGLEWYSFAAWKSRKHARVVIFQDRDSSIRRDGGLQISMNHEAEIMYSLYEIHPRYKI